MGACSYQRCRVPETCPFECLAITAPNPRASKAYLEELVHRVGVAGEEGTKEVLILAVSDPEGVRIGSGGGTLNAILEVGVLRRLCPVLWGRCSVSWNAKMFSCMFRQTPTAAVGCCGCC